MNTRWCMTILLGLGVAWAPAETRLEFGPAEGAKLKKTFEGNFSAFVEEMRMTMNGQEMPIGLGDVDPSEREGEFGYSMEVLDVFNGMTEGRVTDLMRTYSLIEGHYDAGGDSGEEAFEELEGQSIHFVWDDETEAYTRTVQDEKAELEEDLVNALSVELDMGAMLPEGEVSVGDTWERPGAVLANLLMPGIDFAAAAEMESDAEAEIPAELLEAFEEALEEAIIECEFTGMSGEGETESAIIAFSLVADLSIDAADAVASQMDANEMEMEMDLEELTIEFAIELEGELLWNVRGGHFHSYEVGGDLTVDAYMIMALGGGQMEMEGEAEASVEIEVEGSATKAEG